jgi:hypothetical protein
VLGWPSWSVQDGGGGAVVFVGTVLLPGQVEFHPPVLFEGISTVVLWITDIVSLPMGTVEFQTASVSLLLKVPFKLLVTFQLTVPFNVAFEAESIDDGCAKRELLLP